MPGDAQTPYDMARQAAELRLAIMRDVSYFIAVSALTLIIIIFQQIRSDGTVCMHSQYETS